MEKASSFTIQMDTAVKSEVKQLCEKEGLVFSKFIENAVKHELENRQLKEDLLIYANYMANEKDKGINFDDFMESVGVKPKAGETGRLNAVAQKGKSKKHRITA